MNLPTADEIQAAHDDVEQEGTESETTVGLAQLAMTDPVLKTFIDDVCSGLTDSAIEDGGQVVLRSSIMGALICGLNLGIRIGEMREPDPED